MRIRNNMHQIQSEWSEIFFAGFEKAKGWCNLCDNCGWGAEYQSILDPKIILCKDCLYQDEADFGTHPDFDDRRDAVFLIHEELEPFEQDLLAYDRNSIKERIYSLESELAHLKNKLDELPRNTCCDEFEIDNTKHDFYCPEHPHCDECVGTGIVSADAWETSHKTCSDCKGKGWM